MMAAAGGSRPGSGLFLMKKRRIEAEIELPTLWFSCGLWPVVDKSSGDLYARAATTAITQHQVKNTVYRAADVESDGRD